MPHRAARSHIPPLILSLSKDVVSPTRHNRNKYP